MSSEELSDLKKKANDIAKKISCGKCKAIIGGSLAKGTIIKKAVQDIDIFVVFKNHELLF